MTGWFFEEIALSLQLKLKTPAVIKYKLIDTAVLEAFKRPFGDKALEIEIGILATLIFVKPLSVYNIYILSYNMIINDL